MKVGEFRVVFSWYELQDPEDKLDVLFEMPVHENMPVQALKELISTKLKEKKIDLPASRMRLRDMSHRSVTKVLSNEITLKQGVDFLWNGKSLAIQPLAAEETTSLQRTLCIVLRQIRMSTWELGPFTEMLLPDTVTMGEFINTISDKYKIPVDKVSYAKNYWAARDPLEIAELTWRKDPEDRNVSLSDALYLRSGDHIVVKDISEPEKELSKEEKNKMKRAANVQRSKNYGKEKALQIHQS